MRTKKVIFWATILHIISAAIALTVSVIQTKRIIKEIKRTSKH